MISQSDKLEMLLDKIGTLVDRMTPAEESPGRQLLERQSNQS